jgi:uncharacterized protein with GYD domain
MATYILLMKYTDEGVKNIKDIPRRIQQANEGGERMGGKIIGLYPVMGEYDYVCIVEFEDDDLFAGAQLDWQCENNDTQGLYHRMAHRSG